MESLKELTGEIIYVTTPEKAINYKWRENNEMLSPDIQVLSIDDIKSYDRDIVDARVRVGMVLAKHPFRNKYIEIDRTEDAITKEKLNCIGVIAFLLGAKKYETLYGTEEVQDVKIGADGQANYKFVDVGTKFNIQKSDIKTGKYYATNTFSGFFSEENYYQAIEKAKEYRLYYDEDVAFLLETRNPLYGNQLTSRMVKVELTRELNTSLDIAFSLKAAGVFSLNATYNQVVSQRKKIVIETNFEF